MLERGMVPTARVAPFLRAYLEDSGDPASESHGSLPRILKRWENEQEWAEFGSVDRIFCLISDAPLMMWREISDVYYGCNVDAAPSRDSKKEKCKYGHKFTKENTYVNRRGRQECRKCRLDYQAAARARRKREASVSRMAA